MKKIYILLPHKDQFITDYSGSASIWVKDFNKKSKFRDNIKVFGSTKFINKVIDKKRYINLDIPKLQFGSRTNVYIKKFISILKKKLFMIKIVVV